SELRPNEYQLLAQSRFSFLGCWLIMQPKNDPLQKSTQVLPKQLFIFRDSVSAQDFSRLAKIIKQL
ncbi:hypothetical protein, partial [Colwellia sp. E2M01]|uniref:hypothetical protein n=1 Tax=Colwellia sp. E2M01 TaxID=2841561 RepID=UPI001C0921B8